MKKFRIKAIIETDLNSESEVAKAIMRVVNKGDGVWIDHFTIKKASKKEKSL